MSDPALPSDRERRHAPRVENQLLVKFRLPADEKWHMTPLKDLSATGLRFMAEVPCADGTALELQLLLPTIATPLRLAGRVSWARPASIPQLYDYGVEFVDLLPTQREEIDRLVTLYRSRKRPAR